MSYATFKTSVLGKHIGDNECVSLVVNNSKSYAANLFPGVTWTSIFKPVTGAKQLMSAVSTKYFYKITNDHANAAQLPRQGDVMVFDATPKSGYTNKFTNPYGHTGICDKATSSGYWLLQQNAPAAGQTVNVTYYPWNYRPCLGWLRPIPQKTVTPPVAAQPTTKGGDMVTTKAQLDRLYLAVLERPRKPGEGEDVYLGKDSGFVFEDLYKSDERKRRLTSDAAIKDQANKAASLEAQLKLSQGTVTSQAATMKTLQGQLDGLNKQLADADDDNADLKKTVETLTTQLTERNKVVANQQHQITDLAAQLSAHGDYAHITVKQAIQALVNAFKAYIK